MTTSNEKGTLDEGFEKVHHPRIREHEAFLRDTAGTDLLSDAVLFRWSKETHSVSGHLQLLYTIASGIGAKRLVEVGFGRSSKVLMRVAVEQQGAFYCCDKNDFRFLFSETENAHSTFVVGYSDRLWTLLENERQPVDFAFLDYFSGTTIPLGFSIYELLRCMRCLRVGGLICIHDVCDSRYPVRLLPFWVRFLGSFEAIVLPYSQGLLVLKMRSNGPNLLGHAFVFAVGFSKKVWSLVRRRAAGPRVSA